MAKSIIAKKKKKIGTMVPLFALRDNSDLGIGDTRTLKLFLKWAKRMGLDFVQLLPINETAPDNSPYNAISSCALEPLTLDISPDAIPELEHDEFENALELFNVEIFSRDKVNYQLTRHVKFYLLKKSFEKFWFKGKDQNPERYRKYTDFCEREKNWLNDYCLFKYFIDEESGNNNWQYWEKTYNEIDKAKYIIEARKKGDKNNETNKRLDFYSYVQFIAHEQWQKVRREADKLGIELMGDVPFGVNYFSADVFANPQIFTHDWYGGAPPENNFKADEFTKKWGQNWGIPLYHWRQMHKNNFAWWRRRIAKICKTFHMFRIDHVLGFYRIYAFPWRPEKNNDFVDKSREQVMQENEGRLPKFLERSDENPIDAEKNKESGENLLKIIKESAGNAKIIAEDLGFVPDYLRANLKKLGIYRTIVPQWETKHYNEGWKVRPPNQYEQLSYATYSTHDHAPVKSQWDSLRDTILNSNSNEEINQAKHDLRFWFQLGEINEKEINNPPEFNQKINSTLLQKIVSSKSEFTCFNISDILGTKERFNVPGTINDDNWAKCLEYTVNKLLNDDDVNYQLAKTKLEISSAMNLA